MTCPDSGAWRAWLDDEPHPDLTGHLESCSRCQANVESLRATAQHAAGHLQLLAAGATPSPVETAAARERVLRQRGAPAMPSATRPTRLPAFRLARVPTGWRVAVSGLAAGLLLTLGLGISPEGRALAAQFLAQFRSQQVAPLEITPQSQADIQRTMNTLGKLGVLQAPAYARSGRPEGSASTVGSLAEASQRVGFALKAPDPSTLPADLTAGPPRIQVIPAGEVRFTFDKAKAQAYFQSTGHPEVSLPDRFNGATLVVSMPAAALVQYGAASERDALVIGQAGELAVGVEGPQNVSLAELRDFLLGLPEIPADTAAQLRSIGDWRTTLP